MSPLSPNPYTILGLEDNATPEQIKKAYRALALTHHPDKGGDKATFQEIVAAYEFLSEEKNRRMFAETGMFNPCHKGEVIKCATGVFMAFVEQGHGDPVLISLECLKNNIAGFKEKGRLLTRALSKMKNARAKLTDKNGAKLPPEDPLDVVIANAIEHKGSEIRQEAYNLQVASEAVEFLKGYACSSDANDLADEIMRRQRIAFNFEPPQPQFGGNPPPWNPYGL